MKLKDLHSHTHFSDGEDSPEQLIEYAIRRGIQILGISDHFSTTKCESVSRDDLITYIRTLTRLKERYKDQITLQLGIELCMNKNLSDIRDLPYEQFNQLDYVIFEYVEDEDEEDCVSLEELRDYVSQLNCKVGLAHTDLIQIAQARGLEKTVQMIKDMELYWELNVSYPYANDFLEVPFSQEALKLIELINKYEIQVVPGSDTHAVNSPWERRYFNRLVVVNEVIERYFNQ